MPETIKFQISDKHHKARLDEFLVDEFRYLSRMYLRELIRDGKCEVNGRLENRGYLLRTNDFVEVEIEQARQTSLQPERIPINVVFEDESLLVVDKAAGMLIHPTVRVRSGTLLNALAYHLNSESDFPSKRFVRAGLVHRLDKQTSGLVVVSKDARTHRILAAHFQRKLVEKRYYAVVSGCVGLDFGTIDAPVGRFAERRVWGIKKDGKRAVSKFRVIERSGNRSLLELEPLTGRTNQLRIHLAHVGHPIVGDIKYGGRDAERLYLHAYRLAFRHPNGGARLEFETAQPFTFS